MWLPLPCFSFLFNDLFQCRCASHGGSKLFCSLATCSLSRWQKRVLLRAMPWLSPTAHNLNKSQDWVRLILCSVP